jgi:hypothetical protein
MQGLDSSRVAIGEGAAIEYTRTTTAKPVDEFDLDVRVAAPQQPGAPSLDDAQTWEAECPGPSFFGCATDFTCACGDTVQITICRGRTCIDICDNITDDTCRTDCNQRTCETCRTQCGQATCVTCQTKCGQVTCKATCSTCQTRCGQATCATCLTRCGQATCVTCQTKCGQDTCQTCETRCGTCNPHVFTCGPNPQCV